MFSLNTASHLSHHIQGMTSAAHISLNKILNFGSGLSKDAKWAALWANHFKRAITTIITTPSCSLCNWPVTTPPNIKKSDIQEHLLWIPRGEMSNNGRRQFGPIISSSSSSYHIHHLTVSLKLALATPSWTIPSHDEALFPASSEGLDSL